MNLLLDTHVILWWYENPGLLEKDAMKAIENTANEVFVSVATIWEISIKVSLGKLTVPHELFDKVLNDFTEVPIRSLHAREVRNMPFIHNDPFDRLLIAQAKVDSMTLITRDLHIMKYDGIKVLKA